MTTDITLPPLGRYQHYKGNHYQLIDFARHSESHELMAVYRPLYGDMGLWVRPLAMFCEQVTIDGMTQPRFRLLDTPC